MTYIIKDGAPIARTIIHQQSGQVRCAYRRTIDHALVNAFDAKASNAKKWDCWEDRNCTILPIAEITERRELYIPQA